MKFLTITVAPGRLTQTQIVPILNRELACGAPNVMEWHRLFDPALDPRITLENIARAARAEGVTMCCDGQDATLACIVREDSLEGGWSLIVTRESFFLTHTGLDGSRLNDPRPEGWTNQHTLWLILQDDEQAERITRELAAFDPEAKRFTQRKDL